MVAKAVSGLFTESSSRAGALCDGLADYNAQIQALKGEMEDATRIADALRFVTQAMAEAAVLMLQAKGLQGSSSCWLHTSAHHTQYRDRSLSAGVAQRSCSC